MQGLRIPLRRLRAYPSRPVRRWKRIDLPSLSEWSWPYWDRHLTGTPLAGHHRPLQIWVLCLYFMGLNLSNRQIAQELDLSGSDVQVMTEHLRSGLVAKTPAVTLDGEVEIDEVYVVAGHKGNSAVVAKKAGPGGGAGSKASPVGAHWRKKRRRFSV